MSLFKDTWQMRRKELCNPLSFEIRQMTTPQSLGGDGSWAKKEKNKKHFSFFLVLNPRSGPDGPRASGWGCAASGGALAPKPPRATCSQPESIRIQPESIRIVLKTFFSQKKQNIRAQISWIFLGYFSAVQKTSWKSPLTWSIGCLPSA